MSFIVERQSRDGKAIYVTRDDGCHEYRLPTMFYRESTTAEEAEWYAAWWNFLVFGDPMETRRST